MKTPKLDVTAEEISAFKGPVTKRNHKVRITIHLDEDVVSHFRHRAIESAKGYQTLINEALREYAGLGGASGTIADLAERVKRLEEEISKESSR